MMKVRIALGIALVAAIWWIESIVD